MEIASFEKITSEKKTKPEGKISYQDFLDWCGEDTWAEWVKGEIVMVSPASIQHQDIIRFILRILDQYVETRGLGKVIIAPFQMRLESSGREPDIIFVSFEHLARIKDTYLDGPADMVVEIVSQESMRRDRGDKYFEYESAGIFEYWLIDPIRQQAEFYRLGEDKHYRTILPDDAGIYHSRILPGFWLKVSWLWQEPLPPVLEVWKELSA